MKNEELLEVQSFKAVLNKKTKKWVVLAKFRNNKTKIVAFFGSGKEAQEYLKLLDDRTRSAKEISSRKINITRSG